MQHGEVPKVLTSDKAASLGKEKIHVDENSFRWSINEDAMATEKLAEGIRNFAKDTRTLEDFLLENYPISKNSQSKAM